MRVVKEILQSETAFERRFVNFYQGYLSQSAEDRKKIDSTKGLVLK